MRNETSSQRKPVLYGSLTHAVNCGRLLALEMIMVSPLAILKLLESLAFVANLWQALQHGKQRRSTPRNQEAEEEGRETGAKPDAFACEACHRPALIVIRQLDSCYKSPRYRQ